MPTNPGTRGNGKANGRANGESATSGVLGGIAEVIRSASHELRHENETLASFVDLASDQMRRFADQLGQRDAAELIDDVGQFARRRPALFIGGAFLVGLGIARFLKSTPDLGDARGY